MKELAHLICLQNIPDLLPFNVLLFGRVSAFSQELAENGSVVVAFAGGYISITFRRHGHEVHKSTCGHGPNPRSLDKRYI